MLKARLAVAAVGLPLLALVIASPEAVFSAAVTTALLVVWARATADDFPFWTLLPLTALALYGLLRPGPGPRRLVEAWWLGAVAYVGVLGAHWVLLRGEPDGRSWIIVVLAVTFATDTGAYAVGRLVGRHKMAPRISPGKTWEGAAGGYAAGVAAAVIAPLALGIEPSVAGLVTIALTLPAAAEAGDILESALKRRIGVKDASQLLPGHGGLLDRMDSLLVAGPLLYWLLQWF